MLKRQLGPSDQLSVDYPYAPLFAQADAKKDAKPEPKKDAKNDNPEEDAILKNADAFVTAFNKGDAKAIAAFWTEKGEFTDQGGTKLVGVAGHVKKPGLFEVPMGDRFERIAKGNHFALFRKADLAAKRTRRLAEDCPIRSASTSTHGASTAMKQS